MTAIAVNIETLRKHLSKISEKGRSYCITVNTLGHLFYILNDDQGFYVLLVPNKKLTIEKSNKILKLAEWSEKFPLTNYHKTYDFLNLDQLLYEIEFIFTNILQVPIERHWRFEVNSGMMVVKVKEISLDASSRRALNKAKSNSIFRKLWHIIRVPFSSNLNIAISFIIVFLFALLYKGYSTNRTIDYKMVLIILGMGFLYYIILQLRWPNKR